MLVKSTEIEVDILILVHASLNSGPKTFTYQEYKLNTH